MGIFGKPDPQKLMKKGDIEGLTKALRDKDSMVRQLAILNLGRIATGTYNGYDILDFVSRYRENWTSEALKMRERTCWAISKAFLESEDIRVRIEAAAFLKSLYERGELPKEPKKAVRKIMPKLDEMFEKKGKA
jgi:HEAT repeat protein